MIRFHESLADLMVPKNSVQPHPDNPNNGDVDAIIASIMRNGVYRPIIAAKATGHILAGHHLYASLLEMEAEMLPVLFVDVDEPGERRILLADNRIAALAKIDDSQLLRLLELMDAYEESLSGTGYDERDLENLREIAERDMDNDLEINLAGREGLTHTIECPNCHYEWVRGQHESEVADGLRA